MLTSNHRAKGACLGFGIFEACRHQIFIVSLEYKVSIEKVEEQLSAHIAFLEECYKSNIFIVSGRKVPRTGGIIIASAKDRKSLEIILAKDPFQQQDIALYKITEFIPTMYNNNFLKMFACDFKVTNTKESFDLNKIKSRL